MDLRHGSRTGKEGEKEEEEEEEEEEAMASDDPSLLINCNNNVSRSGLFPRGALAAPRMVVTGPIYRLAYSGIMV